MPFPTARHPRPIMYVGESGHDAAQGFTEAAGEQVTHPHRRPEFTNDVRTMPAKAMEPFYFFFLLKNKTKQKKQEKQLLLYGLDMNMCQ